jgi:hypothetical protein
VPGNSLSFAIGLPIQVTWFHNEVEETVHDIAKAAKVKRNGISDNGEEIKPITCQSMMTGESKSGQLGKRKNDVLAPGLSSNSWSDADARSFLLGLYIFGKNFIKIKKFLDNKMMGEMMSYYYGIFYKSDEYRRWAHCRKMKGRKCIIGQKLFTGRRQQELLSRLVPRVTEEYQNTLTQVFNCVILFPVLLMNYNEYISIVCLMIGLACVTAFYGLILFIYLFILLCYFSDLVLNKFQFYFSL